MNENLLINAVQAKFITLPDEEIIFAQRRHWLTFAIPCLILALFGFTCWILLIVGTPFLINYFSIIIPATLFLSICILSIAMRSVIEWYYHIYIISNRKILEISYSPLTSHQINEVLLDQVKCTEIDSKTEGLINELLDIGHVVITFDRPTHEEELVFAYMKSPHAIETYLQNALSRCPAQSNQNTNAVLQKSLVPIIFNSHFNKKKHHLVKWLHSGNYPNLESNLGGVTI